MKNFVDQNICFISTEFPPGPGGIGAHAYNVVNELKKLNWNVSVFSLQENASEYEIQQFNKEYQTKIVRLFPSPSIYSLIKKVSFLIKKIKVQKPSIIMASGKHSIWFGAIIKLILGKPLVVIAHGTEFGYISSRNFKTTKWALSFADLTIAVSKYTLGFIKQNGYALKSAEVIYNGANDNMFYQQNEQDIQLFKDQQQINEQFIIVTVGALSPRKGQLEVIKALPHIIKKHPQVHYYCIGLPKIKDELLKEAKILGVDSHVHILGVLPTNEINSWLNASHLFAMMSTHTEKNDFEGFGIAVIEAALCQKPAIVTSNTSGVIESIIEGKTGIGIAENDYSGVANSICYFIENPEVRINYGINAQQRALNEFTWKIQAGKYDNRLKKLLGYKLES